MARKQITQKRRQRKQKQEGGAGAADFAIKVYGNMGEQHAAAGTNVIAANPVMKGGADQSSYKVIIEEIPKTASAATETDIVEATGGKADLTSVAVPAVLLAASQMVRKIKGGEGEEIADGSSELKNTDESVIDGGKVDLTSIAVPAVLLAANQIVRRRKGGKTHKKSKRSKGSKRSARKQ